MSERREYFRIRTAARVALRVLPPEETEPARVRVRTRRVPPLPAPAALEEPRGTPESRAMLDLLKHIALVLERIDQKIETLIRIGGGAAEEAPFPSDPTEINLSGSGFSGTFEINAPVGSLVEARIDLAEAGLPLITALARVSKVHTDGNGSRVTAFRFEELLPEDLERIVGLTLQHQARELRERRAGGAR